MKLTAQELAYVGAQGLYVTEKCDGCGRLLNQSFRHTIAGKPEVYCSPACRDLVFFGNCKEATKHSTPGKCLYCRGSLEGKKRGAHYCDEICKKRWARARRSSSTVEPQITGTPTQLNQRVATPEKGGQGDCATSQFQPPKNAPGEVFAESRFQCEKDPLGAEVADLSSVGILRRRCAERPNFLTKWQLK